MASTHDSGLGHGSMGSPQNSIDEVEYPNKTEKNEEAINNNSKPAYIPSPKHEPGSGWGSSNPIKTKAEGQTLLETGYKSGKQVYNITSQGKLVKFQPDNSPDNGYHSYEVTHPKDIPATIMKQLLKDGKITQAQYNRLRKGKKL